MALIPLFDYLVYEGPPTLTTDPNLPLDVSSCPNDAYSPEDITHVASWTGFNLCTIEEKFRPVLRDTQIAAEPMPTSVPPVVRNKTDVEAHVADYLRRPMRHALAAGYDQMRSTNTLGHYRIREWGLQGAARSLGRYTPDYSLVAPGTNPRFTANHLPGDARSSLTWRSCWRNHETKSLSNAYLDALAQVNYYMKRHGTRYAYIITELEFVAIERLSDKGELAVSASIPWDARGSPGNPRLTVMLALWYLGMLASHNTEWAFP
ncbi:hypothetical protein V2A60_001932 [Cordyceps javanica]